MQKIALIRTTLILWKTLDGDLRAEKEITSLSNRASFASASFKLSTPALSPNPLISMVPAFEQEPRSDTKFGRTEHQKN